MKNIKLINVVRAGSLAAAMYGMTVLAGEKVSEKFGFDAADSTKYIQAALDSGLPEIVIDRKDTPWIVNPLFARSNQRIVFEPGTVLLAKRGEYKGRNDRIFTIRDCTNVVVVGNGAVLRMWRDDYARGKDGNGKDYARGEWRHGLAINGSQHISVDGLVIEESGGDGIYISEGNSLAKDITIRNCVCDRHHRQALSIISGIDLLIENCVFKNTKGVSPEDGVDVEPNDASGHCVNIVIRNCVSENNAGNGFEAALSQLRTGTPVSVRFENCRSTGDDYGAKLRTCVNPAKGDYPTGSVVYDRCTFTKTRSAAICVQQVPDAAYEMRFEGCRFENIATETPDAPLITLFTMFADDPKPAMPKMIKTEWPDRGNRRPYIYDILDPSVFGRETLPLKPLNVAGARVVDSKPGEFVQFTPIAIRHHSRYVVYADKARKVSIGAKQVPVGGAHRKEVKGAATISAMDGTKAATLEFPGYKGATLTFDAPKAGFYALSFNHGANAVMLTGSDAPVAMNVEAVKTTRGHKDTVNLFQSSGSYFLPIPAGERAEIRIQGSVPCERVGVSVVNPAGEVVFNDPSLLYATQYQTEKSDRDGIWEIRLAKPKIGYSEDASCELAGVQQLLFLSKEKYWLAK